MKEGGQRGDGEEGKIEGEGRGGCEGKMEGRGEMGRECKRGVEGEGWRREMREMGRRWEGRGEMEGVLGYSRSLRDGSRRGGEVE